MSYPCVRSQILEEEKTYKKDFLIHPQESVEQAVELVRRNILTEMDGRDLARCLAVEAANDTHCYTVSMESGAKYSGRHLRANFNRKGFAQEMKRVWGQRVAFRQIILDYFWIPRGSWIQTHWGRSFFNTTLPAFVTEGLLDFSSGDADDMKSGEHVNKSLYKHSTAGSGGGVVYLPFCLHCVKEVIASISTLSKCYQISFLYKWELSEHSLWAATSSISPEVMQGYFGKAINQEDIYCTFSRSEVNSAADDAYVRKEDLLSVLHEIDDFYDVRMIKLKALRKFDPRLGKNMNVGSEKGGFIGLKSPQDVQRGFDPHCTTFQVNSRLEPYGLKSGGFRMRKMALNKNGAKRKIEPKEKVTSKDCVKIGRKTTKVPDKCSRKTTSKPRKKSTKKRVSTLSKSDSLERTKFPRKNLVATFSTACDAAVTIHSLSSSEDIREESFKNPNGNTVSPTSDSCSNEMNHTDEQNLPHLGLRSLKFMGNQPEMKTGKEDSASTVGNPESAHGGDFIVAAQRKAMFQPCSLSSDGNTSFELHKSAPPSTLLSVESISGEACKPKSSPLKKHFDNTAMNACESWAHKWVRKRALSTGPSLTKHIPEQAMQLLSIETEGQIPSSSAMVDSSIKCCGLTCGVPAATKGNSMACLKDLRHGSGNHGLVGPDKNRRRMESTERLRDRFSTTNDDDSLSGVTVGHMSCGSKKEEAIIGHKNEKKRRASSSKQNPNKKKSGKEEALDSKSDVMESLGNGVNGFVQGSYHDTLAIIALSSKEQNALNGHQNLSKVASKLQKEQCMLHRLPILNVSADMSGINFSQIDRCHTWPLKKVISNTHRKRKRENLAPIELFERKKALKGSYVEGLPLHEGVK